MSVARRKKVIILGSTGSIGTSALAVARALPDQMEIVGLAAAQSVDTLAAQAREFSVGNVAIYEPTAHAALAALLDPHTTIYSGPSGLIDLVTETAADMVLVAIVGTAGLRPALAATASGKSLALASKEILVMAGEQVMAAARAAGVAVLPVDSEHNAIFQCMEGRAPADVRRLILTASGGPFRTATPAQIAAATPQQALKHPTWEMGRKITIDSATLFNKGLEMIEARWLFDVPMDRVDVIVHPQSIIHSMVEFRDHSILAQLSVTDMCFPIQYAITYPQRVVGSLPILDFTSVAKLEFEPPRTADFPALDLARHAGTTGGTLPAVMNAANEIAVAAFLENRLTFPGIWETVAAVMDRHTTTLHPDLDTILAADHWARQEATSTL